MCALAATFKRRGTPLPKGPPPAFTEAFTKRLETVALWKGFVDRESIRREYSDLDAIVRLLRSFLLQPVSAALRGAGFTRHWSAGGPWSE